MTLTTEVNPKLRAFYAKTETAKNREERKRLRLDKTVSPEDPRFTREPFEGPCSPPYSKNGKQPKLVIIPGHLIEGTYWTALAEPHTQHRGKYPKKWIDVRCHCGTVATIRLDSLTTLTPEGEALSRWCRSCASRHAWTLRKARET